MDSIRKRKKLRVLPLILAVTLCFSNHFTLTIDAADTDAKKKKMESDLSKLNSDRDKTSRDLASATASLKSTLKNIAVTEKKLGAAKAREIGQYELMKKRIKYIYESSSGDFMQMLLSAESMADLLNKADFISTVSEYDREMLEKLQKIHADIQKQEKKLHAQKKELAVQKQQLSGKYKKLSSMIDDKSRDIREYEKQLAEAKAAAEAAKALEAKKQAAAAKPAKPDSSSKNPGSSSGTVNRPAVPADIGDVALFAGILECEAGSSNYDALLAVATVIMNRVESPNYPGSLSGVIYQSGQFSPTWTGKLDRVLSRGAGSLCYTVARDALGGARHGSVRNCYSFRASFTGVSGITIGDNTFF